MARYRKGNKFLSQEEYDDETNSNWKVAIFIIAAVVTGTLISIYLVSPEWNKIIRFFIVVVPAIGVGIILATLHSYIRIILSILFLLGIVALAIGIISSLI